MSASFDDALGIGERGPHADDDAELVTVGLRTLMRRDEDGGTFDLLVNLLPHRSGDDHTSCNRQQRADSVLPKRLRIDLGHVNDDDGCTKE